MPSWILTRCRQSSARASQSVKEEKWKKILHRGKVWQLWCQISIHAAHTVGLVPEKIASVRQQVLCQLLTWHSALHVHIPPCIWWKGMTMECSLLRIHAELCRMYNVSYWNIRVTNYRNGSWLCQSISCANTTIRTERYTYTQSWYLLLHIKEQDNRIHSLNPYQLKWTWNSDYLHIFF